jgi:hypothetical protein
VKHLRLKYWRLKYWNLMLFVGVTPALIASGLYAQKASHPVEAPKQVERITDHLYRLGKVMIDTQAHTATCSGVINMHEGAIEYLAVAPGGKLHESLLRLDIQPIHLQLALLMLNLEPENVLRYQGDARTPRGAPVRIRVAWRDSLGEQHSVPAEALMVEMPGEKPSAPHNWVFTGSRILKEIGFEADAEKSLIAVWHDPAAILDNPSPAGALNVYAVAKKCPRTNTQVELEISAADASPSPPKSPVAPPANRR